MRVPSNPFDSIPLPTRDDTKLPTLAAPTLAHARAAGALSSIQPPSAVSAAETASPVSRDAIKALASIGSRYELVGEIARGGMGVILKGRDTDLGRDVAVKVLHDGHDCGGEVLHRFVAEARIAGQLQHPNIVPVYELGQLPDHRPYFTMKLVKGQTLAELLAFRTTQDRDLPRFLKIFEQICQAMAYAHANGIIHRDLKPLNVMVGAFGEVQVMDWGLAKFLNVVEASPTVQSAPAYGQTQSGAIMGTPSYMPPEQASGSVALIDERADVFGLGAILCEILTGSPPYAGYDAFAQALTGNLNDATERLGQSGADPELIALTQSCLNPVRDRRPRNSAQVASAVTAYLSGIQEKLRAAELARAAAQVKAEEERKRRRMRQGLAAILFITIVAAGSGASWWRVSRTALEHDVTSALAEADAHRIAGRLTEAKLAVERAEGRLAGGGPAHLRQRFLRAEHDLAFQTDLEEIGPRPSRLRHGYFDMSCVGSQYAEIFRRYDLDVMALDADEATERIRVSGIRDHLIPALDHWASTIAKDDPAGRDRLRHIANQADDNAFRKEIRATAVGAGDRARFRSLIMRPETLDLPELTLVLVGAALREVSDEAAIAFLKKAQRRQPDSFWINHPLALALSQTTPPRPAEAIGYYRVALALRPNSLGVNLNLGRASLDVGDHDGARACFQKAVELDSHCAAAYAGLGHVLLADGDHTAGKAALHTALGLDPTDADARHLLDAAEAKEK